MSDDLTLAQRLAILERIGVSVTSKLVDAGEAAIGRSTGKPSKWIVTVKGPAGSFDTDYTQGSAHREVRGRATSIGISTCPWKPVPRFPATLDGELMAQNSRPTHPKAINVLYCLALDASAAADTFEDFCDNFGYDTDSRSALEMYLACQEIGGKLRRAGVDMAELQRATDGY